MTRRTILALALGLTACAWADDAPERLAECRVLQRPTPLSQELVETSGLAISRRTEELVWTHNDSGGDAAIYAIRPTGALLGSVEVTGAENRDWEDIATGPCPAGDCLYIGDIGDNEADRDEVVIYRVPEPDPADSATPRAERFPVRYPGGPRDAESILVTPDGGLYVMTKGRNSAITLYRYPGEPREDETVELEHVVDLTPEEADLGEQVTGAGATPDGGWIAVRTYIALFVYPADELLGGSAEPAVSLDLTGLGEEQGEAVDVLDNGRVVLSSEGGDERPGTVSVLSCSLPRR